MIQNLHPKVLSNYGMFVGLFLKKSRDLVNHKTEIIFKHIIQAETHLARNELKTPCQRRLSQH